MTLKQDGAQSTDIQVGPCLLGTDQVMLASQHYKLWVASQIGWTSINQTSFTQLAMHGSTISTAYGPPVYHLKSQLVYPASNELLECVVTTVISQSNLRNTFTLSCRFPCQVCMR